MINISNEDIEKLLLIDKILFGISKEELKMWSEMEEIVAKLKGQHIPMGVCTQLVNEAIMMQSEVQMLKSDLTMMKEDMKTLVKVMNQPFLPNGQANYDFSNLKNRYGIYN